MDLFDVLSMIGGLCLFLFGMNLMGQALERRAGSGLRTLLRKLTTNRLTGFLTGVIVTAVIQSSSATTVMVVGFVNSGLMTLSQAFNVIMGANVGTTVTAWILSLGAIDSGNVFVQLLKPSSFTPILALIGIIFYMFCKNDKKKDTGVILLGFVLSFPANELLIPVVLLSMLGQGQLQAVGDNAIHLLDGLSVQTVLCMMVFTVFHWPCATTLLTIRKETGSIRKTAAAFFLPTAVGIILCFLINLLH